MRRSEFSKAVLVTRTTGLPQITISLAASPDPVAVTDVLTYTGYTYRKLHQYDKAEAYYRQALAIAPNHVGATEYYGELMVVRGDMAGAETKLPNPALETRARPLAMPFG